MSTTITDLVKLLVARPADKAEATTQAEVYALLTFGNLNLEPHQVAKVESQVGDGTRRRIDVEVGHLAIEVKRDLRVLGVKTDAEQQLKGYLVQRIESTGLDYAGILTDGAEWNLYHVADDELLPVTSLDLSKGVADAERLTGWLEAVLSTQTKVKPTPQEIRQRLGAQSPAHLLDVAALEALFEANKDSTDLQLKRELWGKLLRTAFGSAFRDSEHLFINHTLLVLSAEVIAHAALGFDVSRSGPLSTTDLTRGTEFANVDIFGVVQLDFFDWVSDVPGGERFIRTLAQRIAQFDWSDVSHDVLKVLYESVIAAAERQSLGEYYTPDWLAEQVIAATVTDPLHQRVLDPSCGSGTFLFHAIRQHLAAADAAGLSSGEAVASAIDHVVGMDVHPVAVTLARVTYLLAVGANRLNTGDRGPIFIPVYLGDSLQWEQRPDIFSSEENVVVGTSGTDLVAAPSPTLDGLTEDLVFPRSVVKDARNFDRLVDGMAERASDNSKKDSRDVIMPVLVQRGVSEGDLDVLVQTFGRMRRLHKEGRDHIWGYYVRNLIRPVWLAEPDNRVDVILGNPPWLRFAAMTGAMQDRFTAMLRARALAPGRRGVAGRDLSTLFVARSVELYLKDDGAFAFVLPHGTLTRQPHSAFRAGVWHGPGSELRVQFRQAWDLSKAATGFPMTSCVVFGVASTKPAVALPTNVDLWKTTRGRSDVSWAEMEPRTTRTTATLSPTAEDDDAPTSVYKKRFRQGAVLAPRVLLFVEEQASAGLLAPAAGKLRVKSRRSSQEKPPWKEQADLTGVVGKAFVRDVHLGETVLPFRTTTPLRAVLPVKVDGSGLLDANGIDGHADLSKWWDAAEAVWAANKTENDGGALLDRVDFHGQLSSQIPAATHRVVYTASGGNLVAARVADDRAIVEHKLYWAPASSEGEAQYLTAILNSQTVLDRVRPFQNLGLFGPRDFDKNVFRVLIPPFDAGDTRHARLAALAAAAEIVARGVAVNAFPSFKRRRKAVAKALTEAGILADIEAEVAAMFPAPEATDAPDAPAVEALLTAEDAAEVAVDA